MKNEASHTGRKIVIGYVALIVIAVFALIYIYAIVRQIAGEEDINRVPRQKIYLVTNTQTLLYESETMGQLLTMEEDVFSHFNETLDQARDNMDSLRWLEADDSLLAMIDTIDMLIERKRVNTHRLMEIWQEANKDLYAKNIKKALATKIAPVEELDIKEDVQTKKDTTIVIAAKKRSFLRRLKEVFVPSDADSSVIISQNEKVLKDTQVSAYDPNAAISKTLKNIQNSVASERQRLRELLVEQSAALRYDNSMINSRINQILQDMEDDELEASLARMQRRENLLGKTAYLITGIALLSVFVIVFFLILIARDLFKSKYYREKLEQAVDSREKLILTISHDVRAPLSSIIGYVELLQRTTLDRQQKGYLHNIGSSSRHILSLVNNLLDYQRLESGEMSEHKVPFRIPAFFEEVTESFRPLAEAKGLDLSLSVENPTDQVFLGDSVRIRQIVGNLMNNAIKFTPTGTVELIVGYSLPAQASEEGEDTMKAVALSLVITVRDSGPGIEKEQQQKIFAAFSRLAGAEKTEGFGLGLSISTRLVALLGGKLELQSEPGKGSDFIVTLPLELSENQELAESEKEAEETKKKRTPLFAEGTISCLIIDDDLLQIALLEEILRRNNILPVSCTNPHSAVDFLRKNEMDLVISDMQMPGMSGTDLIKAIRNSGIAGAETLPVIVLSGEVDKNKERYRKAGFTDALAKPFSSEQLLGRIVTVLPEEKKRKAMGQNKAPKKTKRSVLSNLTQFAGGDKAASDAILQTFFSETRKHINIFVKSLENNDREAVAAIAHKLIPLFTMLEAEVLVQQLKILQLNQPELTDSGWRHLVGEVIKQTSSVMEMENNM